MKILTAILLSFLLTACQLTEAERDAAVAELDRQQQAGIITQVERDLAVERIEDQTGNWEDILLRLGTVAGSVLLAIFGVRQQIGTPAKLSAVEAETLKSMVRERAKGPTA